MPPIVGVPEDRAAFLAFGNWLMPSAASQLDQAIARLRERGEAFSLKCETKSGYFLEARGRATVGRGWRRR